ncbi:MAG TPA: ABC transporter permease [Clostridia bacterium]|jgi:cell division transport system permease protein|nr:ABC transporter permease [Clostridia bacterium]
MKLRTYGYFIRQAFKSIFRNGWMSAASIATVSVSLIILGAFVLVVANTNYIASQMESDVEIAAYLEVETPEEETEDIQETISDLAGVSQVELVTKEEGLRQLNEQFGKDHDLIAAMGGENPLPDYLLVRAEDPEKVPVLAQKIEALDYIESVDYGQGVVERLFSLTNWIRVGGLVTIILLAAATVFLIAITIRITIFARKKEIEIMQCVGATRWFIRCPFFLEGMFLGFTGSLIACITLYFSYLFLVGKINSALSFLPVVTDLNLLLSILLIVLVAGPFVGAIGSMLSLRRFLQV